MAFRGFEGSGKGIEIKKRGWEGRLFRSDKAMPFLLQRNVVLLFKRRYIDD